MTCPPASMSMTGTASTWWYRPTAPSPPPPVMTEPPAVAPKPIAFISITARWSASSRAERRYSTTPKIAIAMMMPPPTQMPMMTEPEGMEVDEVGVVFVSELEPQLASTALLAAHADWHAHEHVVQLPLALTPGDDDGNGDAAGDALTPAGRVDVDDDGDGADVGVGVWLGGGVCDAVGVGAAAPMPNSAMSNRMPVDVAAKLCTSTAMVLAPATRLDALGRIVLWAAA